MKICDKGRIRFRVWALILSLLLGIGWLPTLATVDSAWAASTSDTVQLEIDGVESYTYSEEIVKLVNEARQAQGLSPLRIDSALQKAAMIRALENEVCFGHMRPDGSSWRSVTPEIAGENVAIGYGTPKRVMDGWLTSTGHKANILNSAYTSIGVGVVYYNGMWYWAQAFGRSWGDGKNNGSGLRYVSRDMQVQESLLTPEYTGPTTINYRPEGNTAATVGETGGRATYASENQSWTYVQFPLPANLFTFETEDSTILQVDEAGRLTGYGTGKTKLRATLKANPTKTVETEITVKRLISHEDITLSCEKYTYSGSAKKPKVSIDGLTSGEDFTVTYQNNVKAGIATVTVTGKGLNEGTATKQFQIWPKKPSQGSITGLYTGKSHYVRAKWKKVSSSGYQVRYSTSKSFKRYQTVTIKGSSNLQKTIRQLKKGKRYYVKVRAYKTCACGRVYGKFSTVKSIVCK